MSTTTTTNTGTTEQADTLPTLVSFQQHVAEATTREQGAAIITEGLAIVAEAEAGTGLLTFQVWQGMGTVAEAVARMARGTASKAKVTQAEAHAALSAIPTPGLPAKQAVGRWLRASRITTDTRTDCVDAYGEADGPVSLSRAIDILTWCEAKQGTTGTTNRGTATATKAEAEAKQAEQAEATKQAEQAKQARRDKQAKARGNVVHGLLTLKVIREATTEQLTATIVACQDQVALRTEQAEATAKAEREATKATKQATKAEADATKAEAERMLAEAKAEAERMVAEAKAIVAEAKATAKAK